MPPRCTKGLLVVQNTPQYRNLEIVAETHLRRGKQAKMECAY